MRLVQMSARKKHVRSTGSRDVLTRQPKDGRERGGGLRSGEMENAALVAHGAAATLQARVCTFADACILFVCAHCETMCDGNVVTGYHWCEQCDDNEEVRRVRIPYALLVTANELMATGIDVKFIVDKKTNEDELETVVRVEDATEEYLS
jgi:DNA-directed RNA polymerase beta subunit